MSLPPSKPPRKRKDRASAPAGDAVPDGNPDNAGAPERETLATETDPAAIALEHSLVAMNLDDATVRRVKQLPHDVGWLLFTAGVVGMIMPGVLGTPFLILGGLMLWPRTSERAEHWLAGGHASGTFKGSARQINRFLDDLERRYPKPAQAKKTKPSRGSRPTRP